MENGYYVKVDSSLYMSKSADGSVISVGDEETGWVVKFGKDLAMYKNLDMLVGEDGIDDRDKDVVMGLAMMWFTDTNTVWDEEFMLKRRDNVKEFLLRVKDRMRANGDSDNADVIAKLVEK